MLERQLNRLKKKEMGNVRQKDNNKHGYIMDDKIKNCLQTMRKYEALLLKMEKQLERLEEEEMKKGDNDEMVSYGTSMSKGKKSNIYKEILCEDCGQIYRPNQYFVHKNNGQCVEGVYIEQYGC